MLLCCLQREYMQKEIDHLRSEVAAMNETFKNAQNEELRKARPFRFAAQLLLFTRVECGLIVLLCCCSV
jgi:hypothetical protein